jgi:L-methionine (R)-S-oxide reductase
LRISISMSQDIHISGDLTKEEKYLELLPQLLHLTEGEPDLIANMANITSVLKEVFNWLWVGFYFVRGKELVLGPFQGSLACTRIGYGKGVCGKAWEESRTVIVDDVDKFPGHIACSAASKSEIVVPVKTRNEVVAVLDIDSQYPAHFDQTDKNYLEKIASHMASLIA